MKCEFRELMNPKKIVTLRILTGIECHGLNSLGSLRFITAKNLAKRMSETQLLATTLPHFWAKRLSLQASEKPISRIARTNLLSRRPSNFLMIERMHLAKVTLRTLLVTFIVKSTSTLSILGKALNHTPERMALSFSFTSCVLSRKLKALSCGAVSCTVHLYL